MGDSSLESQVELTEINKSPKMSTSDYLVNSPPKLKTIKSMTSRQIRHELANYLSPSRCEPTTKLSLPTTPTCHTSFDISDIQLVEYSDSETENNQTESLKNNFSNFNPQPCTSTKSTILSRPNKFTRDLRSVLDSIENDDVSSEEENASQTTENSSKISANQQLQLEVQRRFSRKPRACSSAADSQKLTPKSTPKSSQTSSPVKSSKIGEKSEKIEKLENSEISDKTFKFKETESLPESTKEHIETKKRYSEAYKIESILENIFAQKSGKSPTRPNKMNRSFRAETFSESGSADSIFNPQTHDKFKHTLNRVEFYANQREMIRNDNPSNHNQENFQNSGFVKEPPTQAPEKHRHSDGLLLALGDLVINQREIEAIQQKADDSVQLRAEFNEMIVDFSRNHAEMAQFYPEHTVALQEQINFIKTDVGVNLVKESFDDLLEYQTAILLKISEAKEKVEKETREREEILRQRKQKEKEDLEKKRKEEAEEIKLKAEIAQKEAAIAASDTKTRNDQEALKTAEKAKQSGLLDFQEKIAPNVSASLNVSQSTPKSNDIQVLCATTYAERRLFFDNHQKTIAEMKKDPQTKPFRMPLKKAISTVTGNMSARSGVKTQEQVGSLIKIFKEKKVDSKEANGNTISADLGDKVLLAADIAVDCVIGSLSFGKENIKRDCYLLGLAITAIWIESADFGQLFLSSLTVKCPQIIPFMKQKPDKGQSQEDFFAELGWKSKNGKQEEIEKYFERIEGLFRIYVSVCQSPMPPGVPNNQTHPHGISNLWKWLAIILNNDVEREYTVRLLSVAIEQGGHCLFLHYKNAYVMMLKRILGKVVVRARSKKEDASQVAKLEDECNKQLETVYGGNGVPPLVNQDGEVLRLGTGFWLLKGETGISGDVGGDKRNNY